MMFSTRTLIGATLFFVLGMTGVNAQYQGAEPVSQDVKVGWDSIDKKISKKWLTTLSSDAFEGRATGTKGYQKAADFMAARFKEFGLIPIGDQGSYFQHVPFARIATQPSKSWIEVAGTTKTRIKAKGNIAFGFEISGRPKLGSGQVEGEVIVISALGKDAKLEDPSIINGKIVVVNARNDLKAPLRQQLREATPLAVLAVKKRVGKRLFAPQSGLRMAMDLKMSGLITEASAKKLMRALKLDPALAEKPARPGTVIKKPQLKMKINIAAKREDILVPNVIGKIEGSDPELKHEVVMLGSHLDHIGKSGNKINNGADDDGSGTTALLAIARAMTKNPKKPRRSVAFIAVCGEEMGLLGSRYYVENPIIPIEDTICELQMDMVGRNEEHPSRGEKARANVQTVHLVGSKRLSMDLHELIIDCNRHLNFVFEYDEEDVYTRSDHYNFAKKGIPVSFIFSGFHRDYHQPTDTVDKINFEKLVGVARLYYLTAFRAADRKKRLVVDSGPLATVPSGDGR